ncbi:MAG: glycosyltransferase family 4 protein [Vampirovibrionales bacterium]|nr:glycosyltransferase family 4 protein [Vampirovibrionales bacterium]
MKIVMVNNFLTPHGGAEFSTVSTHALLLCHGHESVLFGCNRQPYFDVPLPHQADFPSYTRYEDLHLSVNHLGYNLKAAFKPFWNLEAKSRFDYFLDCIQPDLVHFNSIFWHLSPSLIQSCTQRNIPSVMTLHDSRLVCPAGTLLRGAHKSAATAGHYCVDLLCSTRGVGQALHHRCYDDSLAKSAFVALEFQFRKMHRQLNVVSHFICPSQALADVIQTGGRIEAHRLHVIANALSDDWFVPTPATTAGDYFLFVGRLSREKGCHLLIDAMASLPPSIGLKIVGDGEQRTALEAQANALGRTNIEFLGHLPPQHLKTVYGGAIALVLPCLWFEAFGRVLLESMACGRPAIASAIGGCTEIIQHEKTGLLITPNHHDELVCAMRRLVENPDEALQWGSQALERSKREYHATLCYQKHLALYEQTLSEAKTP